MYGLYEKGATLAEVSRTFGISSSSVSRFFKEAGLKVRTPATANVDEMYQLYQDGATLEEVGICFGITPTRVSQIFREAGLPKRSQSEATTTYSASELTDCLKLAAKALGGTLTEQEYEAYARSQRLANGRRWPSYGAVTPRFGSWGNALKVAGIPRKARKQNYSEAELLDCLRSASEALGGELAMTAYNELARDQRLPDGRPWPTCQTPARKFGSWRKALEAAGVPYRESTKAKDTTYSDAELLDCLRLAADAMGGALRRDGYNKYAGVRRFADGRRWPGPGAAMSRFGSWTSALERAGIPTVRKPAIRSPSVHKMYALYQKGATLETVGERFGISGTHVSRLFTRAGLESRPATLLTPADVEEMYQLYRDEATLEEVGICFGITPTRVWQLFRKAGLPTRTYGEARRALYSDAELVECLRLTAGALGGKLGQAEYDAYAGSRRLADGRHWPGHSASISRFGSWASALEVAGVPRKAPAVRYSDPELLDCLRTASKALGGVVSSSGYDEYARDRSFPDGRLWPTYQASMKRFGSWRKALEAAGVPARRAARAKEKIYSDAELLDCLSSAGRILGEKLSVTTYDQLARSRSLPDGRAWPTHHTPMKRFGSWRKAREAAGVHYRGAEKEKDEKKGKTERKTYSDAELVGCLRLAADALGGSLSQAEYSIYARSQRMAGGWRWPTSATLVGRFGSWTTALDTAGIPRKAAAQKYSDAELLDCLRSASQALGGVVAISAYDELARDRHLSDGRAWPSHPTMKNRFGSWRKALEAASVPHWKSTKAQEKTFSDDEVLDCLRSADQVLGGELKFRAYDELARDRRLPDGRPWPTHNTPMSMFGSWRNALKAAGLSHKLPGRQRTFSDSELLDCLRRASQAHGGDLTVSAYTELARNKRLPDGRPWPTESAPKKRFGTWRKALEAAGAS